MTTTKKRENGAKIGFGNKSAAFLEKKSRQAVELYTDTFALFYEIDFENSQRNFYGELLIPKWKNAKGVKVYGTIEVKEMSEEKLEMIPNKILEAKVSCYIAHLREIGLNPQLGDIFSIKNRFYYIVDRTLLDANKGAIVSTEEALSIQFTCLEADNEMMLPACVEDGKDTYNNITGSLKTGNSTV